MPKLLSMMIFSCENTAVKDDRNGSAFFRFPGVGSRQSEFRWYAVLHSGTLAFGHLWEAPDCRNCSDKSGAFYDFLIARVANSKNTGF